MTGRTADACHLDRSSFTAPGLTQIPPRPHLLRLQERFGGTVMLCIDVSGSMNGEVLACVARMKAENILFVTRGPGPYSAHVFGEISVKDPSSATIADVSSLAHGIATMATLSNGLVNVRPHKLTREADQA